MRSTGIALALLALLAACAPTPEITSFEECAAAGYPVMESYPEQCRTPDGRNFVREIPRSQPPGSPYLYLTEAEIKREIAEANYCEAHADCVDVDSKCPFGCYTHVNKAEAGVIREMIHAFQSTCAYACIQFTGVKCQNKKCILIDMTPELQRAVENARVCQADSDCAWVSGECLGCGTAVNDALVQDIRNKFEREESGQCRTSCPEPQGQPRCIENRCGAE